VASAHLHRKLAAAERFSNAAERYEQSAHIQKEAAVLFDAWLAELKLDAPQRIAEIGCGTGLLTRLLHARFPQAAIEATDLAPAMVEYCRRMLGDEAVIRYRVCDGRDARFDPMPDWIVSAMCLQWLRPLRPVLQHHLAQSKMLAFSLVLDGSFSVWREAHAHAGIEPGLHAFPVYDSLLAECQSLGAAHVHAKRISLSEAHANGLEFAASLRLIGADHPRDGHRPSNLRPVLRQLQNGFDANYEIGFFCIEK
jgi:malonyl-CoA O-methyltransferase